jgi:hypothetical protein
MLELKAIIPESAEFNQRREIRNIYRQTSARADKMVGRSRKRSHCYYYTYALLKKYI